MQKQNLKKGFEGLAEEYMVSNLAELPIVSEMEERNQKEILKIIDRHKNLNLLRKKVQHKNELLLESEMTSFTIEPTPEPEFYEEVSAKIKEFSFSAFDWLKGLMKVEDEIEHEIQVDNLS